MKKILIVCGNGLGSSFMVSLKVEKILKDMGIEASVEHTDLTTAKGMSADLYLGAADLVSGIQAPGRNVVGLVNLLDDAKLKSVIEEHIL
jgi:PTS system ascorbate-specific IIB component